MASLTCGACQAPVGPSDLICPQCMAAVTRPVSRAGEPPASVFGAADAGAPAADGGAPAADELDQPVRRCGDCDMAVPEELGSCPYCLADLDTLEVPGQQPAAAGASPLPAALASRFRVLRPLPATGAEADLYVVADDRDRRFVLKLYRYGVQINTAVLDTLAQADLAHVVHIEEHGQVDGRGYELLEEIAAGDLVAFQRRHGPRVDEPIVRMVLRELADALEHLHGLGLQHGDLKPGNVLVRSEEPFDLVLADFGLAAVMTATIMFTDDQRRSRRYAAPEQLTGAKAMSSDIWALGVIAVELLLGVHPLAEIAEQTIDFHLRYAPWPVSPHVVEDEAWQQLLRGMLHPDPVQRFTIREVQRWLAGGQVPDVSEPLASGPQMRPFRFAGGEHTSREQVARVLVGHWETATSRIGQVRSWVAEACNDPALLDYLDDLQGSEHDLHGQLLRVVLRLDPELPPVYRGFDVSTDALPMLAAAAVANGPESHEAHVVTSMLAQDVPGAIAELTGSPDHRHLAEAISAERGRLTELVGVAAEQDLEVDDETRAALELRLVQVIVDPAERQRLAADTRQRAPDDLPGWYRALLDERAAAADIVIAAGLFTPVVEQHAATREERRRQRLEALRTDRSLTGRLARGSRLAVAVLVGSLAAFLPLPTLVALALVAAADRYGELLDDWLVLEVRRPLTFTRVLMLPLLVVRWVALGLGRLVADLGIVVLITGLIAAVAAVVTSMLGLLTPDLLGTPAQVRARLLLPAIVAALAFLLLQPGSRSIDFPRLGRFAVRLRLAPTRVHRRVILAAALAVLLALPLGRPDSMAPLRPVATQAAEQVRDLLPWWLGGTSSPADTPNGPKRDRPADPEPEPAPEPDPEPTIEVSRWQMEGAFALNVREGPALDARVLTTLSEGESLTGTGRTEQADGILWVELELPDGTVGWASSRYLVEVP